MDNFPFPHNTVDLDLIHAIAEVKKAAALAHKQIGEIDEKIASAIMSASDQVIAGELDDQFPTCALQGGAGTSINMNVNEVIASKATEVLNDQGNDTIVHPNDHVNKSQSTNDVNPSALRIVCIRLSKVLIKSFDQLIESFNNKAKQYENVQKLGRTHIQDAVPITFGEEMQSYAATMARNKQRIKQAVDYLYDLNLGGTAVGNSINVSKQYIEKVYEHLQSITGLDVKKADNLMSGTSSGGDICHLSAAIHIACTDISKIAKDIRILSSGPRGGIGEIMLEPLQPGSSIMPGKVNPVLPEAVNQLYYLVSGYNLTIHQASHGANLELGVMFPIMADTIIKMLKLTRAVINTFSEKCIDLLQPNKEKCQQNLEMSTAYATLLTPILGYDTVSKAVKTAIEENKSLREVIVGKQIMTDEEFSEVGTGRDLSLLL